ncbi:PAS domain-containing sensor histidine kinase [Clostridium beijerinckii]|uniref:PAS domain-containing sensor histidine kinase n=1 Tax=Clostridium beijerinckii TaxID=1520 RepID=UPI00047DC861|nr:PAS domain-containing sensor histidine kinase [Clostridium beijerinckii]
MKLYNSFDFIGGQLYIVVNNGIATEISQLFVEMTEYSEEELLNKNIKEVFSILRIGPNADLEDTDREKDYFLFTKSLDARFINIDMVEDALGKVYIFLEKPNSRLDVKFPSIEALCSHNKFGIAVFSTPDITLLKANQTYLNFLDKPFNKAENSIGKMLHEIISGWAGSSSEDIWRGVLSTQKPFYSDEYMFEFERGVTYWEASLAPVFEDGILKYCIEITTNITEKALNRKRIEEQAKIIEKQNEQLMMQANLLNLSHDAILAWEINGSIIYWNKSAEEKYGYSTEEAIGCVSHNLLKTRFPIKFSIIKSILLSEGIWNSEIEQTKKDGTKLIVETRLQLIVDENGKQIILETNRNITENRKMEKELQIQNQIIEQQKEELEIIIDNMADGLTVVDKYGKYTRTNKKVVEYTKKFTSLDKTVDKAGESFEAGEIYYDEKGERISLEDFPSVKVVRGEKVKNQRIVVKHGDDAFHFDFNATPVFDDSGEVRLGIIINRDVTEQVDYERHIKEQKELFEVILDNMQESIYVFDKDGKYVIKNKVARERLYEDFKELGDGYRATELYDLEGNKMLIEETPIYRVKCGEIVKNNIVNFKKDGMEYYNIISGTPVYDSSGDFLYGVVSFLDVTEMMKSQQDLKEVQEKLLSIEREKNEGLEQAMEMKDEFLSFISHEFRTPLNVINTAIQTLNLIYSNQMTEKIKTYMGTIKQNTNRQLRLVNNILDITRANAGRITINKKNIDIVFLTKAITESVYEFASKKGVRLTFVSKLTKKIIGIDDEKYERIILNLLSNAIKFTPAGKSIVVNLHSVKTNVCVEVKDNGIGIPKSKVDVIFERFGQVESSLSRQAEGTGIGLSLVKRFVEALGGSVTVKSNLGKGATFKILLADEKVIEEQNEKPMIDLMNDNRLVQTTNIEFSDIYL